MNKRTLAGVGVVVCLALTASQYVFAFDLGEFVWPVALMTVVFAAVIVTTSSDKDIGHG